MVEYGADTYPKTILHNCNTFKLHQRLNRHFTTAARSHRAHVTMCRTNEEKEKEDHARLPAQMPASRVSRNPGGNNRQERKDAMSGQKDGNHRADNAWVRQQDRTKRRSLAFVSFFFRRKSGLLSQWCSSGCALGCSATVAFGCVCSSHVSGWLRLVEVFVALPHLECLAFCRIGMLCFIAACGYGRRVMRARPVFRRSGASGMGANAGDRKSTFAGVLKTSAPSCKRPLSAKTWGCCGKSGLTSH